MTSLLDDPCVVLAGTIKLYTEAWEFFRFCLIYYLNTNGVCNNGQVFSWPLNFGFSDWNDKIVLKDFVLNVERHTVHQLVL